MKLYQCWGSYEDGRGIQSVTNSDYIKASSYAVAAGRAIKKLFGKNKKQQVNLYVREVR